MPVTTLDPITALIVVDLQKGVLEAPLIDPIEGVLACSRELLDAFRQNRLPVVLVNVDGRAPGRTEQGNRPAALPAGFADLLPDLDKQPTDILVTKQTWGAFARTGLEAQLRAKGVTQVVLAGVATGTGVEATARQAYELGFHVTLALDAMTDVRPEAGQYSVTHVFPRLGETGTTREIIRLLEARNT